LFPPFTCFAHRGASGYEPENTLLSFRRALELGATWLEFDVRIVEGEAVVFHDRTLARCTGDSGALEKRRLSFVRSLDAGKGERIPLLSEVLDLALGRAGLQIELKSRGAAPIVADQLARRISDGVPPESFLISSFDFEETAHFRHLMPQVPVALLLYGYPRNAVELARLISAVSVHLNLDAVTPARVAELHAASLKVFIYTVNDAADLQYVKSLGVDGVFSDFPDRVA